MPAYAWYYVDYDSEVLYWSYSRDMSTTEFAEAVSNRIGKRVKASDTSYANGGNRGVIPLYNYHNKHNRNLSKSLDLKSQRGFDFQVGSEPSHNRIKDNKRAKPVAST